MYNNWEQFKNLPKIQTLSPQEQARQYFLYQSNMMMENNFSAAASSAAAGAGSGAGGGGGRRSNTGFRVFGFRLPPTGQDDNVLFNLRDNSTLHQFTNFDGPAVFETVDNTTYFVELGNFAGEIGPFAYSDNILFGSMDSDGNKTIINDTILEQIGGAILSITYSSVGGSNGSYYNIGGNGLSGSNSYGAQFDITVSGGLVSDVITSSFGDMYKVGDNITVEGSNFGGTHSLVLTVEKVVAQSIPTSMYFDGQDFIYCDRLAFISYGYLYPKIVRVSMTGTASLVSTTNIDSQGFYLTSLVKYDGDVYATSLPYGVPIGLLGPYDIDAGLFTSEPIPISLNNAPGISISKVWFVIDMVNIDGKVYANLLCNDKVADQLFTCIAELNMDTCEAEFLYFTPYNNDYLYTNIVGV